MRIMLSIIAATAVALGLTEPAMAYVGPGAGLSLIGAFLGLLAAVGAAVGFLLLWPFRRMLKRRKAPATTAHEATAPADAEPRSR